MEERQIIDSIVQEACQNIEDEIGALIGTAFKLGEPQIELVTRSELSARVSGAHVVTRMKSSGGFSCTGFILTGLKQAIRLGGSLIMLPPEELVDLISGNQYNEEVRDSYGEIGNIVASAYTNKLSSSFKPECSFEVCEQTVVEFSAAEESNLPIPDYTYYSVVTPIYLDGEETGLLSIILPAAKFGLVDEEIKEDTEEESGSGETHQDPSAEAGTGAPTQMSGGDPDTIRNSLDSVLEMCRTQLQEIISEVVGAEVRCTEMKNMIVSKEQFFLDETKGRQVVVTMEVGEEPDHSCHLYLGLKDAIYICSTLLMLSESERAEALSENEFSLDLQDGYGEISSAVAEVYSEMFHEHHEKKLSFQAADIETLVPMKVDIESDIPIKNQTYYLNRLNIGIDERSDGRLQMLFPTSLLGLDALPPEPSDSFPPKDELLVSSEELSDQDTELTTTSESSEAAASSPEKTWDILIISDGVEEGERISTLLEKNGVTVFKLNSRDDLSSHLPGNFKAVLLVMEDIDEHAFGMAIKVTSVSSLPLIATGSSWTRSKVVKAVKCGVNEIMINPVTEEDIREKVMSVL